MKRCLIVESGMAFVRVNNWIETKEIIKLVVSFFFLMIRQPPRSTQSRSSAASDVYKRQGSRSPLLNQRQL